MAEATDVEPGTGGKEAAFEGFGVKVATKGYHFGNFLQILMIVLLAIAAFMLYEMKSETKAVATAVTAVATVSAGDKVDHDKMTRAIEKTTEAQDAANYILTLSQTERERLNLRMPESLRRRHER